MSRVISHIFTILKESIDIRYSDSSIEIINHSMKLGTGLIDGNDDENLALFIESYGLISSHLSLNNKQQLYWHYIHQFEDLSNKINKKNLRLSQLALAELTFIIAKNCAHNFPISGLDKLILIVSNVGCKLAENGLDEDTSRVTSFLKEIFEIKTDYEEYSKLFLIIETLSNLSDICIEKENKISLISICSSLSSITNYAIKKNYLGFPSKITRENYEHIIKHTEAEEYESVWNIPSTALKVFKNIENYSIKKNHEELLIFEIFSISRIAIVAAQEEKPEIIERVLNMILVSSVPVAENNFEDAISMIIGNLNLIGNATRRQHLHGSFANTVFLIVYFGILSSEKKYSEPMKLALSILAKFSDDSGDVIENAINKISSQDILTKFESFLEASKQFFDAYRLAINQRKNFSKGFDDYLDFQ